ncbi:MAG: helix-turn-helix domain-containing protein [Promethearchaeota archaeon]
MEKISTALDKNIKSESKIISIAVIEGDNNVVYSTDNWDISKDVEKINLIWRELKRGRISINGVEYVILQCTPERIVAINLKKQGSFIGFKDEERKIICRLGSDGLINFGLTDAARILCELRSKEPYMEPDSSLGKLEKLKWATPRILLDDTNNLQELGLIKFGLSIEEAKVYLTLLKKGNEGEKVGNLNKELDIKRTTIYRIIERLIDKDWVVKLPVLPKGAQIYIARPLNDILDERIQQKEEELKVLKSFRFIMGKNLANGWINLSEINKTSKKKAFNFKTLGITGVEKDCGLLIFEYDSPVENDIVIRAALQLSCEKLKFSVQIGEDIEEYTNPDLKEIKFDNTEIQNYIGAIMYLKFKKGSKTANNVGTDWIIAAKLVAIPIDNKIYVIWGTEEKFPYLMNIII